jgi:TolB-like protein
VTGPSQAVFLSYASEDAAAAERICEALRTAGVEVWFDKSELRGGDAWDRKIDEHIRRCQLFIPVISAHTEARDEGYFRREWGIALDRMRDMAEHKTFLVPVVIDGTDERGAAVPERFRQVQWSRLANGAATQAFVGRIAALLGTPTPSANADKRVPDQLILPTPQKRSRRTSWAILWLATLAIVAGGAWLVWRYARVSWMPEHRAAAEAQSTVTEKSIAVLPFVDMSEKHDQEYFSDGLSEELIDALTKIPDLYVPARTSSFYFKGKSTTVSEIAKALAVSHILEGSVRKAGNQLRVTAQLVRADNGYHLWSQTYDRQLDDIFKVQDDITAAVVGALKVRLLPAAPHDESRPASREAYEHYLAGRHSSWRTDPDGHRRAAEEFKRVIAIEPDFGPAYSGLAAALVEVDDAVARRDARALADKGVALAPRFAEAYQTRGYVRGVIDFDVAGAQADLEEALRLDPASAIVRESYAQVLATRGHLKEAVAEAERAVGANPLASNAWANLGRYRYDLGDFAGGRAALAKAVETASDPIANDAHYYLGSLEVSDGHPAAARAAFAADPRPCVRLAGSAIVEHVEGHRPESDRALAIARTQCGDNPYILATVYAVRGDMNAAFPALDRARARRDDIRAVTTDRLLEGLRKDPRYRTLLREIGLTE